MPSSSTRALDRSGKLRVYATHGVSRVWFVEPTDQLLDAFRLDGDGYRSAGTVTGGAPARLEPFAALELPLSALWQR